MAAAEPGLLLQHSIGQIARKTAELHTEYSQALVDPDRVFDAHDMVITHTTNIHGRARIYLGVTGSLQGIIEPIQDTTAWTFVLEEGLGGSPLEETERKQCAIHILLALCKELDVTAANLPSVPFEIIANLHTASPLDHKRMAVPKKQTAETSYMANAPKTTRPRADFEQEDVPWRRRGR